MASDYLHPVNDKPYQIKQVSVVARTKRHREDEDSYTASLSGNVVHLGVEVHTFHRTLQQAQLQMTTEICLLHESKKAQKENMNACTLNCVLYHMDIKICYE